MFLRIPPSMDEADGSPPLASHPQPVLTPKSAIGEGVRPGLADFALAAKAHKLAERGLRGAALGVELGVSTVQANHLAAIGRQQAHIEGARLSPNELRVILTIAEVNLDSLARGVTASPKSRDVEWRARKYSGWCAATVAKRLYVSKWDAETRREVRGLGLVDLAGNGYVNLTLAGWAVAHAVRALGKPS